MAWFFALALAIELVVVAVYLFSGAAVELEAAIEAVSGEQRTDLVSAFGLAVEAPQAIPGISLSILQPLSPTIAAFVVAVVAFGFSGAKRLGRGYRFWSREVGWRRGLGVWGLMALTFLAMSLVTAGLNRLLAPDEGFVWVRDPVYSAAFLLVLCASLFLDIGGVTEETGWRGFALPILQGRATPFAASAMVGLMWGVWHLPARPDILTGAYGLGGGATLLGLLLVRFVFLSVVMTYFYNRAGGSILIAVAMHGLHNDAAFLQGRITSEGLGPYVVSELTLLAPIVVVAAALLILTGRKLGLHKPGGLDPFREATPSPATGGS